MRYSESPFFDDRKWSRIETLFAMYKASTKTDLSPVTRPLKIFVTVGTVHQYRFERLIQLVKSIVNENDQVIWQIGEINSMDVIGECHREITEDKFSQLVDWADVVITHSGVGSILTSLDRGKYPIVVPRLSKYGEHVDDHQLEIASVISNLELGSIVLDSMDREVLYKSLSSQIVVREKGGL
jgi:UDP-N-acetylglucosamine transferase subunit ALG13